MRKWIPAFLLAASGAFASWAYLRLPSLVSPRWDALLPWVPVSGAEPIPRLFAAFGIPVLAFGAWCLLRAGASPMGERLGRRVLPAWLVSERTGADALDRFGPTFDIIVTAVVGFLLLFHVAILGTALGWPDWTLRAFTATVGLGIIVVGNVMPRTKPNWIAGVRTKRVLSDPDLWRRTHRRFGGMLLLTGIAVILASLFSAPAAILTAVIGGLVSALAATVVGRDDARPGSTVVA